MYKLVLILLMMVIWMFMHALQTDEEMAVTALFQGKHAVNRAAHAAAQQVDRTALADGRFHINETAAFLEANRYLQANLQLDENGKQLPGAYLREKVEVLVFEVINDDRSFPFTYRNSVYDYEVTLKRPGVIVIAHVIYPRVFTVIDPIEWMIKGTAELVVS
ncbi:hypothetical protein Back11_59960 [Paenibacillus baekrokdamisoli]|uniref:Uncharacterized protein n=1 Tax=Paenibacillus baekrokdamisoli TaxID=1712516 RepID=A0A3G9JFG0_9BACL|nr:hypothetical protein [Paenibacillus baekrokdamisoli]MBB3071311.1 hypothetical protein [Paenibacillus baekrokdamisoli]BBH24651.1 hypothetical protein Back11_59960 [Paenibacillus baekrokdamisoli]